MYQLLVIANSDGAQESVNKHLKDVVATNVKSESLGRKQLAYPIKKVTEAEYILWSFEAEGASIVGLNQRLRLEQELVLRYLITIFDPNKVTKVSNVAKVSEAKEEPAEKAKPKVTVTTKVVAVKKDNKVEKVKRVEKEDKSKKEPKKGKK